jgi:hypothetical protein
MSKTVAEKIAGMKFPMEAVGKVTLGKAEYAAGEIFDALTIDNVNFLKSRKAANSLLGTTRPVAAAAVPTEAVKASAEQADRAGTDETKEVPNAGTKGTPDDRASNPAGRPGSPRK